MTRAPARQRARWLTAREVRCHRVPVAGKAAARVLHSRYLVVLASQPSVGGTKIDRLPRYLDSATIKNATTDDIKPEIRMLCLRRRILALRVSLHHLITHQVLKGMWQALSLAQRGQ